MIQRWLKAAALTAVLASSLLPFGAPKTFAAATASSSAVSIEQTGEIVTATNGILTIDYDLSTGRGNFTAGATRIMSGFYSDYSAVDTDTKAVTRFNSYDAGTRTAEWSNVGTDGTDKYGTGQMLTLTNTLASGASMVLHLSIYEGKPFALVSMTVNNASSQTISIMEPVAADNLDIGDGADKRIYTAPYNNNTDFGVAPVNDFGYSENGYDRPQGLTTTWSPFNGTSYWVAAMFDNTNKHGFIGGAATTFKWKSMESLKQASAANGPLTGFSVYNAGGTQSGTSVDSDLFFLGYYDDYRDGLEQYGSTYAIGDPKLSWNDGVPMGYNTYYTYYGMPTDESMHAMVDYFADNLKSLGYTYMNLDCCFKGPSGTGTSEDFKSYADYVHSKGMKAGGYEVPFAIWWDLSEPVPAAPEYTYGDIALKDDNGVPIKTYLNTYIVDATHPGGQAFIRNLMHYYFVSTGFDYVKLDFLDFGMFEGKHFDPNMNGIQAYRLGMQIARDELLTADRDIFIDESIAPLLPSGYAHGRRSGIDTTIPLQNNLYSGIERQALNAAASWWTNGTLYQYNDPDMAIPENIANGFYKYPLNESRLKSTIDFLEGGHLILGDNMPFVSEDRFDAYLNPALIDIAKQGKAARPVSMTNITNKLEHSPTVIYSTDNNGDKLVGMSNWNLNESAANTVTFSDLGLSPSATYTITELYSGTKLGTFTGSYTRTQQKGESVILRISTTASSLPEPSENLAIDKPAAASSEYDNYWYAAWNARDGDEGTRWSAADGQVNDQWLEIDLEAETDVNRVIIKEDGGGNQYFPNLTYTLQYWNGTKYVDITKGYTLGDKRIIDFPTVTTSKLRLYMNKNRFLPSIREFEIYNVPGNTGNIIDQDDSSASYSKYSDIRATTQRMQTFSITSTSLPKVDFYLYESYVNDVPKDNYYIDIVELDADNKPSKKLFTASLASNNIPGDPMPYSIYPRLTGLDTTKKYAIVLRSPNTVDDNSTNNKYGFAYADGNPYPGGFEAVSHDGGVTWSAENNGERDLIFTIYKTPTVPTNPPPTDPTPPAQTVPTTPASPTELIVKDADLTKPTEGNVSIEIPDSMDSALLPVTTADLLGKKSLTFVHNKMALTFDQSNLESLKALIPNDQLDGAKIRFTATKVSQADTANLLKQSGRSGSVVTIGSKVYDFRLSVLTKDNTSIPVTTFKKPLTLTFQVDPNVNPDLLGVYYIAQDGTIQYAGGTLVNGVMTVTITHFSSYAVLEYKKTFSDVSPNHWANEVILKMAAKHIVNGVTDTTFVPEGLVTRAEFAAMIARALGLSPQGESKFKDVNSSQWFADAVIAVNEAGIVTGRSGGIFAPAEQITREEMAVMIVRAYEWQLGKKITAESPASFEDHASISPWAQDAVAKAQQLGLISGRGNNQLVPQGLMTRAEGAKLIASLLK
ncbi:S-layer homology domain-containing protein [Paenibacillus sp. R14(2021)]|uniref:S-layer homology domain-containing protein n=1 Tax=Paenibacillus sp. R14(2021) TaxID=2859228 RepID=UPI001C611AE6|nr:S-layer homology domain-containing protein [Paenibacillus sp. R14(2021)]